MLYIYKILSKNNSKFRLSFYLPWIGIFIGTIFLLLINSIMDGMENEIFLKLNKIDSGYKVSSSSLKELDQIKNYLDINNIHYSEQLLRDVVVASKQNYLLAKIVIGKSRTYDKQKREKNITEDSIESKKVESEKEQTQKISIGRGISRKLGLLEGDFVQVFSPLDVKLITMDVPNTSFLVNDIYEVPVVNFDEIFIFSNDTLFANDLETKKYFLLDPDIDEALFLTLEDIFPSIVIQEWLDEYSPLINAIKLEKQIINLPSSSQLINRMYV